MGRGKVEGVQKGLWWTHLSVSGDSCQSSGQNMNSWYHTWVLISRSINGFFYLIDLLDLPTRPARLTSR